MTELDATIAVFANRLTASERPLSARRLLKLCADTPGIEAWTVIGVEEALRESGNFLEVRRGVFAPLDYQAPREAQLERPRRNDRRQTEDSEGPAEIVFPETMDEMVSLRRKMGSRDSLRVHLMDKLRTQSIEQSGGLRPGFSDPKITENLDSAAQSDSLLNSLSPVTSKNEDEVYKERRESSVAVKNERRDSGGERQLLSEVGVKVQETLETAGRILTAQHIVGLLRSALPDLDDSAVRMAVFVDNERCRHLGAREPFVVREGEGIGLTSWGLPKRFLELESKIQHARVEQEELVKRSLLHRLSELSLEGYRQAVALVLERNGVSRLSRQVLQLRELAFYVCQQRRGTQHEDVLVSIQKAWTHLSGDDLRELISAAEHGSFSHLIVMTLGTLSEEAIDESKRDRSMSIQLVDGEAVASLFYEAKVGLRTATWTLCYPDLAFFKGLGED